MSAAYQRHVDRTFVDALAAQQQRAATTTISTSTDPLAGMALSPAPTTATMAAAPSALPSPAVVPPNPPIYAAAMAAAAGTGPRPPLAHVGFNCSPIEGCACDWCTCLRVHGGAGRNRADFFNAPTKVCEQHGHMPC